MKSLLLVLMLSLVTHFLTGCGTTTKTATEPAPPAATKSAPSDTVRYTPTGSWISKKVKRSEVTATDQEAQEAQRAMGELQRRGNKPARGPGG